MFYSIDTSFEMTFADLLDCYKKMDRELPASEEMAKQKLIRLCKQIIEEYGKAKQTLFFSAELIDVKS